MTSRALAFLLAAGAVVGCGSCGSSEATGATSTGSTGSSSGTTTSSASTTGSGATTSSSSTGGGGPMATIHYVGRFDSSDPMGPKLAWPGSAIATRFQGTSLTIHLADSGTNYFTVTIDGGAPTVFSTNSPSQAYVIAQGLADGPHDAWIEKQTESFVGTLQALGFDLDSGHSLVPTPEPFARRMEFIGDSITCGYGDTGNGPSCSYSPDTEDEYLAYGAVTARALNAEHTSISYSGIGVLHNSDGSTDNLIEQRFERTVADDPNSTYGFAYQPDVVVINLGTNDFSGGDPGQPYVDAYTAFAGQVRGHYPSIPFVFVSSPMLTGDSHTAQLGYLNQVKTNRGVAGDTAITVVDLPAQDGNANGFGCDYHPSVTTQASMSATLVPAIKQVMGW